LISVVVTVYNSEKILQETNRSLLNVLSKLDEEIEIVYVDDGSSDDSWKVLTNIYEQDRHHVRILRLAKNFGQFEAVLCGIQHTTGDIVVNSDDDLQFPPDCILQLIDRLKEANLFLVYGIPRKIVQGNWITRTRNTLLNKLLGKSYTSSFRAFRREIIMNEGKLLSNIHFELFF